MQSVQSEEAALPVRLEKVPLGHRGWSIPVPASANHTQASDDDGDNDEDDDARFQSARFHAFQCSVW